MDDVQCLQILGFTSGIPTVISKSHAFELVNSKLGVLLECDPYIHKICVGFFSEPVVSLVACERLINYAYMILERYHGMLKVGYFAKGLLGEFIVRTAFLLCQLHTNFIPFP